MAIKSNIDGVDIILEGAELEAFLAQREKDAAEVKALSDARALALAEAKTKREAALSKLAALGLTADDFRALGL